MIRSSLPTSIALGLMLATLGVAPLSAHPSPQLLALSQATSSTLSADPGQHVRDAVRMLRRNDVAGLLGHAMPKGEYLRLRAAYEAQRAVPLSAEKHADIADTLARINDPKAVDLWMQTMEPKLQEARPKANGAIMMGLGAIQVALASNDNALTAEQRASLQAALPGLQQWVTSTDFLDAKTLRQAAVIVTQAARNTGVDTVAELQALTFEQMLANSGRLLASAKQAIALYGIDLDAIADSLQVQVLAVDGDTAHVRATVTVFDAPVHTDIELKRIDGGWYNANAGKTFSVKTKTETKSS